MEPPPLCKFVPILVRPPYQMNTLHRKMCISVTAHNVFCLEAKLFSTKRDLSYLTGTPLPPPPPSTYTLLLSL